MLFYFEGIHTADETRYIDFVNASATSRNADRKCGFDINPSRLFTLYEDTYTTALND